MIACFPDPYQDELVYSWITRYFQRSGYLSLKPVYDDIYALPSAHPNVEFLGKISDDAMDVMTRFLSRNELVINHTMFPYYARFLPTERRQMALEAILRRDDGYRYLIQVPRRKPKEKRFLKYCPVCSRNDRMQHGETYWHRMHQPTELTVCPIHHCRLSESNIPLTSAISYPLTPAEEWVPQNEPPCPSTNNQENLLSTYVNTIFEEKMDMTSTTTAVDILQEKMLNTHYISTKGERRNIEQLYADITDYYGVTFSDILSGQWRIQSVLEGRSYYSFDIGMIAMFLGVDPHCLARLESPNGFKSKHFLSMSAKHNENMRSSHHKGYRNTDWPTVDREMLPLVKDTLRRLTSGKSKPQKISACLVASEMNIPHRRFWKCPMCMAEIKKYYETQEEYWARLTVWSVKKLVEEGRRVNRTHINEVSHIRTCDFSRYEQYIDKYADIKTAQLLRLVLK